MCVHAPDMRRRLSIPAIGGATAFFAGADPPCKSKFTFPKLLKFPANSSPPGETGGRQPGRQGRRRFRHPRPLGAPGGARWAAARHGRPDRPDGTVDLVCDPGMEIPLELENRTLTLAELLEALQYKRSWSEMKGKSQGRLKIAAGDIVQNRTTSYCRDGLRPFRKMPRRGGRPTTKSRKPRRASPTVIRLYRRHCLAVMQEGLP